jgi:hypothetical protein
MLFAKIYSIKELMSTESARIVNNEQKQERCF